MPVDDLHPQYSEFAEDWQRCRDSFGGRRLIKAERTKYLPWLEATTGPEYDDYIDRAQWFDATERTTKGLTGAVVRNDTRIDVPQVMEPDLDDVTLSGQDVHAFSQRILMEQILMGRVGVEVAMPAEESPEQRPYWNLWAAESITNWAEARIFGKMHLVLVVLKEPVMNRVDSFGWDDKTYRYRVMRLVPFTGDDLVYVQEIWVQDPDRKDDEWVMESRIAPMRRGVALDHIPFTIFGASSIEAKVEKPPMIGLADLNIGWYLNSADYENALAAIKPLYFFSGIDEDTEIILGSRRAVIAEDANGDGKILQGADPVGLKDAMAQKRQDMGIVGGQMLEPEGGPAETLGVARIRQGGRQASLRTIATTFGVGLRRVLAQHAKWIGTDPDAVEVSPNMDFVDSTLTPEQVNSYMAMLQDNRISYLTFYHLLQGGELTRPGVDADEEQEEIENQIEGDLQAHQGTEDE